MDLQEVLWGFSIISVIIYFLQGLRKTISNSKPSVNLNSLSSFVPENPLLVSSQMNSISNHQRASYFEGKGGVIINEEPDNNYLGLMTKIEIGASKSSKGSTSIKLRKRPAMLVVPEYCPGFEIIPRLENREIFQNIEGRDFFLACKKGSRDIMEDSYGFMVDILGDPKQAFFTVIDGHGGQAAAVYVAQNLGKNIVKGLENVGNENGRLEQAIRRGYSVTDREFLSQGVSSGACAASVLLKDGELHVANVGDCRVVLSRKGVADAITNDHRLSSREDERLRIESSGGFVHCRNGVWRVLGSLAVSRAIGDLHLKQWIISEPEIKNLRLTSDCQFLIMASDGLWDKVHEQEAVNVVLKGRNAQESCKKLVDISCGRGNMDDITVMVVNLENFVCEKS